MSKQHDISLDGEIRRVIKLRVLICFCVFLIGFVVLGFSSLSTVLNQLEDHVESECAMMTEFTVNQLQTNNVQAVEHRLNHINRENQFFYFEWVKPTQPLSIALQNKKLMWEAPFAWKRYCPIQSSHGVSFGYFKVSGSFIYNHSLFVHFILRIVLGLLFFLTMVILLYPLGKKIPEKLFVKPVMDLLNLIKNDAYHPSVFETDTQTMPIEIREVRLKLIQMLKEAESHSREVAFGQIAAKVAHDIRSPLAALNMLLKKNARALPVEERNIIRGAAQRINDIANNLLEQNKKRHLSQKMAHIASPEPQKPELAAILLENIVSEKRAQYIERKVHFQLDIDEGVYGFFVDVNANELNRALSNLINNAVEAIRNDADDGSIHITLSSTWDKLSFSIDDNGCGMSPEQLSRVLVGGVTIGKDNGSGIGLSSAMQSIASWSGHFSMTSKIGKGTHVNFTLPMASPPEWFLPMLVLKENMTILLLDDDDAIHQLWIKKLASTLRIPHKIVHCYRAEEFFEWFEMHATLQDNTLFLIDYELLGSSCSGIEIIKKLNIADQSILVTNWFYDENVRAEWAALGVKIMPKNFVTHIPLRVLCAKPDLVFIDDSVYLTEAWKAQATLQHKNIVVFNTLSEAEQSIDYFAKETPLYIDSNLDNHCKGEDLAKRFYEKGFHTIYLCTGMDESMFEPMPWIKAIVGKEYPD